MIRYGRGVIDYYDLIREEREEKLVKTAEEAKLDNLAEEKMLMERIAAEQTKNDNPNYRCHKCNKPLIWQDNAYICETHGKQDE